MSTEKLLAIMETPASNEAKLDAVLKEEMSEDAVRAVRAALRLLDGFKDEIPSDTLAGLADAAGMDMHEEMMVRKPHHYDKEKMDHEEKMYHDEKMYHEDKEKMSRDDMKKQAETLLKSADIPDSLRPTLEQLFKSNQDATNRVSELESVLKAERDGRLLKAETERVNKSYSHVPGVDAEKLANVLIDMRKHNQDNASTFEAVLSATEAAMVAKSNGAFEETGATVPSESGGRTAWAKIENMAGELVTKGEAKNKPQAIDVVLLRNPELYAAYLAEK